MKLLFSIICLYFSIPLIAQQSTDIYFFEKQGFEKVVLSKYSIKSKTFSAPPLNQDTIIEKKEEKTAIYERTLTKKEVCKILKNIKKIKKVHASDVNYDVKISFFNKKNEVLQKIEISSFTQNIILKKENCKKNNDIYPCLYLGSINNKFNRYIQKLFSK